MKRYSFFILCLIIPILSFAQASTIKYEVSPAYPMVKNLDFEYFSNKNLGVTVCYKVNYGEINIQSYDTEFMKVIATNKLDRLILNLVWVKDKLYGFYEFRASKKSTPYIYAREINYKTCEFVGKEIKLFSAYNMINELIPIVRVADVLIEQSEDKSKLLIYALHSSTSSNKVTAKNYVSLLTVNQNFEKIHFHKYKMPDVEEKIADRSFMIDNLGIPYMIYKVYNDNISPLKRSQIAKEKSNYHVNLFRFNLEEKKQLKVKIPFEASFLARSIGLFQGKNDKLLLAGYYNINREDKGVFKEQNVEGGFLVSVDTSLKVSTIKTYPIEKKFIFKHTEFWDQFVEGKPMKRVPTELKRLVVRDLIIEDDNSVTIVGEQYHNYTRKSEGMTGEVSTEYYYYENLLITKLDKDREIIWMTKVPRRMRGFADLNSPGYIYTKIKENHYFFINDIRENPTLLEDNQEIRRQAGEHHGTLTLFKVNSSTGKLSKQIIFDMMDVKGVKVYNLRPDRLMWCSDNEFIIECHKKKKEDVMIKVRIND